MSRARKPVHCARCGVLISSRATNRFYCSDQCRFHGRTPTREKSPMRLDDVDRFIDEQDRKVWNLPPRDLPPAP